MAGIYFHIPFCKKACHYCDFHFSTTTKNKQAIVDAMLIELEQRKNYLPNQDISTIYFGGGTPSLLSSDQLIQLLKKVSELFDVDLSAEITLEANPDDLTEEKLKELKSIGINRLSIGIQSFYDRDLQWMNRSHNADQAMDCVRTAQDLGFENITIDLIYGIPNQTIEEWQSNLDKAIALNVPHISSYCLTVEPKTALAHKVKNQEVKIVEDEVAEIQFRMLIKTLSENGFEQYEISNFAKDVYLSKHNSNYWKGEHYLGIGPSAHSFNGISRQWNVANNNQYVKAVEQNLPCFEVEVLTKEQQYNEYILTTLRTKWGVDEDYIFDHFGQKMIDYFKKSSKNYRESEFLLKNGSTNILSEKGKFLADRIASDLFYT